MQVLVNPDTVRAWLDAHRVKADAVDPRAPAGRHQQPVTPHVRAVIEVQDVVVLGALDDHRLAAETAHHLGQFDACGPAAEHEQAARDGLHARGLAAGPRLRQARGVQESAAPTPRTTR